MDMDLFIGLGDNCATCGAPPPPGSSWPSCNKCHKVRYCSRDPCQVAGWKKRGHKQRCGQALPKPSIVQHGTPELLVDLLREFGPAHATLSTACLEQSAQMCMHSEEKRKRWVERGGLPVMQAAMAAQLQASTVQMWGAVNMRSAFHVAYASLTDSQRDDSVDTAAIGTMVRAIAAHPENSRVTGTCLASLATIIGTCTDDSRQLFATKAGVWPAIAAVLRSKALPSHKLLCTELENACAAITSRLTSHASLPVVQEAALRAEVPQAMTHFLLERIGSGREPPLAAHAGPRGERRHAGLFALRVLMLGSTGAGIREAARQAGCPEEWIVEGKQARERLAHDGFPLVACEADACLPSSSGPAAPSDL